MLFDFKNKELQRLYETGKSRKYRLPSHVKRKFVRRINQVDAATTKNDLAKTVGLHFEKLRGHANRYSIRIDRKWRLEFEVHWEDKEETRGTFLILELSKHYGD